MALICSRVLRSGCPGVPVCRCPGIPVSRCPSAPVPRCPGTPMSSRSPLMLLSHCRPERCRRQSPGNDLSGKTPKNGPGGDSESTDSRHSAGRRGLLRSWMYCRYADRQHFRRSSGPMGPTPSCAPSPGRMPWSSTRSYTEISLSFSTLEALEDVVMTMDLQLREVPRPALLLDARPLPRTADAAAASRRCCLTSSSAPMPPSNAGPC